MKRFTNGLRRSWDALLAKPREELVLSMTLVLMLLLGGVTVWLRGAIAVLCLGMLMRRSIRNPWPWTAAVSLLLVDLVLNRFHADNHKYLLFYWSLACCLATWTRRPAPVLEWNGRLLIALTFCFATFWKVAGGEYLDGSFFLFKLLADARFASFTSLVSGLDLSVLEENRQAILLLKTFPFAGASITLQSTEILRPIALAMCWLTIAIEGAVAWAFLRALKVGDANAHNGLLVVFCVGTYALAPVIGFAYVLIIAGIAQCPQNRVEMRAVYLVTFAAVTVLAVASRIAAP